MDVEDGLFESAGGDEPRGIEAGTHGSLGEAMFEEVHAMPVLDVDDVVELEHNLCVGDVTLGSLMDEAGRRVYERVCAHEPNPCDVCILTGSGNNGGDGWVAARLLAAAGYTVTLVAPRDADCIRAHPAREAAEATMRFTEREHDEAPAARRKGSLQVVVAPEPDELQRALGSCRVVVDALLGTGFAGNEVREPYADWIRALDDLHVSRGQAGSYCTAGDGASDPFTISVDVPSGLSARDGACADPCMIADETVTMMVGKPGLVTEAGRALSGHVLVAHIADLELARAFIEMHDRR